MLSKSLFEQPLALEQCGTHCDETLQPHSPTKVSCVELICLLLASSQLLTTMHHEKQVHAERCSNAWYLAGAQAMALWVGHLASSKCARASEM